MMIVSRWCALGVALMAFAARGEDKPRIVVLQIDGSTEALKRIGAAVSEQVLTELQRTGRFDAMGTSDLQVLLGMERQRSLLGCSPEGESACLAEISAALGAPWLVAGSLAQFGKATRLDLKLISARDGKAAFRDGMSFSEESALFGQVSDIVKRMVSSLEAPTGSSVAPLITTVGGGVLTLAGASVLLIGGLGRSNTTATLGTLEYSVARSQLNQADTLLLIGSIATGLGVATLFSGLVWWKAMMQPMKVAVSFAPSGVVVQGSF